MGIHRCRCWPLLPAHLFEAPLGVFQAWAPRRRRGVRGLNAQGPWSARCGDCERGKGPLPGADSSPVQRRGDCACMRLGPRPAGRWPPRLRLDAADQAPPFLPQFRSWARLCGASGQAAAGAGTWHELGGELPGRGRVGRPAGRGRLAGIWGAAVPAGGGGPAPARWRGPGLSLAGKSREFGVVHWRGQWCAVQARDQGDLASGWEISGTRPRDFICPRLANGRTGSHRGLHQGCPCLRSSMPATGTRCGAEHGGSHIFSTHRVFYSPPVAAA